MAQVLTSDRIALTVMPERLQLLPGSRAPIILLVTNTSNLIDEFSLKVEGIDASWFRVGKGSVSLLDKQQGSLDLEIRLPQADSAMAGTYNVRLTVVSRADPGSATAFDFPLEVLPVGGLELLLRPQVATVRRKARYTVRLTNASNAEREVDLVATDPEEALELKFAQDRVALAPDAVEETQLVVRPLRRPLKAPPRTYTFRVLALPVVGDDVPPAEPLAGADGTLIFRSLLEFLIGWSLRRKLLALLAALLLAALAIWALVNWGVPNPGPKTEPTVVPTPTTSTGPGQQTVVVPTVTVAVTVTVPPTVTPKPALPTIDQFEVTVPPGGARGQFLLKWKVTGADEVKVDGQKQELEGSLGIQTLEDKQSVLEATNAGGTVRKTVGIVVLHAPDIQDFKTSPEVVNPGDAVTLTWSIKRAQRADIDGQAVTAEGGSRVEHPTATHQYTLIAQNEFGSSTKQVIVQVSGSSNSGGN